MVDSLLALRVEPFSVTNSLKQSALLREADDQHASAEQRRRMSDLEFRSKEIDLGEKESEAGALAAYRSAGGGNSPKALSALKGHPDILAKAVDAYSKISKADQDTYLDHLERIHAEASKVAALPDGSPEQQQMWGISLDKLYQAGAIGKKEYDLYKGMKPNGAMLDDIVSAADVGRTALRTARGARAGTTSASQMGNAALDRVFNEMLQEYNLGGLSAAEKRELRDYLDMAVNGANSQARDFGVRMLQKNRIDLPSNVRPLSGSGSSTSGRGLTDTTIASQTGSFLRSRTHDTTGAPLTGEAREAGLAEGKAFEYGLRSGMGRVGAERYAMAGGGLLEGALAKEPNGPAPPARETAAAVIARQPQVSVREDVKVRPAEPEQSTFVASPGGQRFAQTPQRLAGPPPEAGNVAQPKSVEDFADLPDGAKYWNPAKQRVEIFDRAAWQRYVRFGR